MPSVLVSGQIYRLQFLTLLLLVTTTGFSQSPAKTPASKTPAKIASGGNAEAHAVDAPNVLRQMNRALEELAAKFLLPWCRYKPADTGRCMTATAIGGRRR